MADLQREEWIAAIVRLMAEATPPFDPTTFQQVAEKLWNSASHRSPANVVQDMLIERFLKNRSP